ncbi:MAG: GxxExxY protein [Prevotella multiformis]|uniref:GxxExxY protein n=1 Tax=Prevotella multiformis TaxID=282402 RepID=UPI003FA096F6
MSDGRVINKEQLDIGNFVADMAVENKVIVGLKAASSIFGRTFCSVNSCLTTTGMEAGYILDFGRDREFGRRIDPGSLTGSVYRDG